MANATEVKESKVTSSEPPTPEASPSKNLAPVTPAPEPEEKKWIPIQYSGYLKEHGDCRNQVVKGREGNDVIFEVYPMDGSRHIVDFKTIGSEIIPVDSNGKPLKEAYSDEEYEDLSTIDKVRLQRFD